jgi:lactoylglutathione lyase
MTVTLHHVHLKSRDPRATMRYYMDNFGATLKTDTPERIELDLDGLQLNISDIVATQKHEQHYGIEHMAIHTDTYTATLANLRRNGVEILEELTPNATGRRVCFVQAPDGAQMEVIEKL